MIPPGPRRTGLKRLERSHSSREAAHQLAGGGVTRGQEDYSLLSHHGLLRRVRSGKAVEHAPYELPDRGALERSLGAEGGLDVAM